MTEKNKVGLKRKSDRGKRAKKFRLQKVKAKRAPASKGKETRERR